MVNKITIQDTGKYNVAGTLPTATTDERASGSNGTEGSILNLTVGGVKLEWGTMTNSEGQPEKKKGDVATARFDFGEVDKVGVGMPVWTISGVFDMSITAQAQDYGRLCHMVQTKGIKKLGVDTSSINKAISYRDYGTRERDGESTKTITHVNVRIDKISLPNTATVSDKLAWKLELVETR